MPGLLDLPPELILCIVEFLDYESELSALSRTTRLLYPLLNPVLYTESVRFGDGYALAWAAIHGHDLAFQNAIEAGAKPTSATLALATVQGHEQTVRMLCDAGVDVNAPVLCLDGYPEPGEINHREPFTADKCAHESIVPGRLFHERNIGFMVSVETPIYIPPLCAAAHHGHLAVVEMLVDAGAQVNVLDMQDDTPLFEAAHHGHIDVVRFLLQRGADPNLNNPEYSRPLYAASSENHLEVVRCLLDHGARPTLEMLRRAASLNHSAVVDFVLNYTNHPPETLSDDEQTLLACIAAACGLDGILKRLIGIGWDVNSRPCATFAPELEDLTQANQATPLSWAAYNGHVDTVRLLLSHDADPGGNPGELVDGELVHFPLALPLLGDHARVEIVQILLDAGADWEDYYECDILRLATRNLPIFKLLLDTGIPVDGITVEAAILKNDPELLQTILDQPGVVLTDFDPLPGAHTLLQTSAGCSKPMLDILLQNGFNPNPNEIDDEDHQDILEQAAHHGNTTLLTILIDRGFDIARPGWQAELLQTAANGPNHAAAAKTVDLLLRHGLDVNARNERMKTPLHLVTIDQPEDYDSNAVSILMDRGADPFIHYHRPDPRMGVSSPIDCASHDLHRPKYEYIAALLRAIDGRRDVDFGLLEEQLFQAMHGVRGCEGIVYRKIDKLLRQYYWRKVDEQRTMRTGVVSGSSLVRGGPVASRGLFVRSGI